MKQFDTVALVRDLPEFDMIAGTVGTIIDAYQEPAAAFEVESCDAQGRTIAQVVLPPGDLRLVLAHSPSDTA